MVSETNQKTYDIIAKEFVKQSDSVLDVGCGSGRLAELFINRLINYTGIDFSSRLLDEARKRLGSIKHIDFLSMDMRSLVFPDESFNVVFMIASLHHLKSEDHEKALLQAYRVLKPGGYILMTNFNLWKFSLKEKTWWRYKLAHILGKSAGSGIKINRTVITSWRGHPLYYHAFTKRELKRKVLHAGFFVEDSYYVSRGMRSSLWKGDNLVLIAHK
jgi:ubiquinone/menaquinone biosynthesis C-methylase UbiE